MTALPVTLLTGFLGSGKTTLLNALLAHPGMADTAVIINEYGEVGIDHLLVRAVADEVTLLESGCVCCTVRGELASALRDLAVKRVKGEVPEFRRVLIETTGLADPAPIVHTLAADPVVGAHYRLDGVVATVDATCGVSTLDNHWESAKQAAIADRLVLTKTDLADRAAIGRLEERLHRLNPGARLLHAVKGDIDPATVFEAGLFRSGGAPDPAAWLAADAHDHLACDHGHDHDHDHDDEHAHGHDHGVTSFVITREKLVSWPALAFALEMLAANRGDSLLRIKGIVHAQEFDTPLAIHGVQHLFHPPAPLPPGTTTDNVTRIVFITRGLSRESVDEVLAGFLD